MALPTDGKLVRNHIPDIIRANGEEAHAVRLGRIDYSAALGLKLLEEAAELVSAQDEAKFEELADVYEVVLAIAADLGVSWDEIIDIASAKRAELGGFDGCLWLLP